MVILLIRMAQIPRTAPQSPVRFSRRIQMQSGYALKRRFCQNWERQKDDFLPFYLVEPDFAVIHLLSLSHRHIPILYYHEGRPDRIMNPEKRFDCLMADRQSALFNYLFASRRVKEASFQRQSF
jgi:hypothetical protein